MRKPFRFEREKFLKLKSRQQHKKCAEFLRQVLEKDPSLLEHYNELAGWLGEPSLSSDPKALLDRMHSHLMQAGQYVKEHSIFVRTQDRAEASDYLPITIYLDNLRSAHNIGSILRTTEAMRLGSVVYTPQMADAANNQLRRAAMGALDWVSYQKKPLSDCPRPVIAVETVDAALPYYDFSFPDTFTLAFGNEEYGLSDEVISSATTFIQIPLYGRKNSLNVAASFAIIACEISKQKRAKTR